MLAWLTTPYFRSGPEGVCIRAARQLESLLSLWSVAPADELLSDRQHNQAHITVDIGRLYIIYFLSGGDWIDIDTDQLSTSKRQPHLDLLAEQKFIWPCRVAKVE